MLLFQRYVLLFTWNVSLLGFENIKEMYANNDYFFDIYNACDKITFGKFYKLDGYLYKEN